MSDAPTTPDPIEIAMEAEATGAAPSGVAREVLTKQSALIGWQIASERAGFALKVLTGAAGLAAAMLLAAMAWQANQASGVVIKPFSVPPSLAQRGVTGEAVASRLMDQLSRISEVARSGERQRRVAADWGGNVSIEIPATGVSIGQVEQWLRDRLGHETRLTGEVTLDPEGRLELETRLGGRPLTPQVGTEAELGALVLRTAEELYAREQPQSWSLYLSRQKRWPELLESGRRRAAAADPQVRALGYLDVARALTQLEGDAAATPALRKAVRLTGDARALSLLSSQEAGRGHDEAAYRLKREAVRRLPAARDLSPEALRAHLAEWRADAAALVGDNPEALVQSRLFSRTGNPGGVAGANYGAGNVAQALAQLHDIGGAREAFEDFDDPRPDVYQLRLGQILQSAEDWAGALASHQVVVAAWDGLPDRGVARPRGRATVARALVGLGRLAEAEAILAATPLDCAYCVRVRGLAAEARGDRQTADHWFGQAVRMTPSLPFANHDWARALLARGDAGGALARFAAAEKQSPHFPDAREGRGEALLALGDTKGAGEAFAAAAKLAPKWGRLHVKWGGALAKQGKADEARAQWRLAAGLYLTPAERAELERVMR